MIIFKTLQESYIKRREGIIIYNKPFLFLLFAIAIYFILSGLLFGFTYESNDDPAFENCLRGVYWNSHISNFYFYYRGIALFFVWLYQHFDIGINWYGWSLILESLVACLIICYLLYNKTKSFWTVILFLMLYQQSVFLVSFTRISIFLSFAALFFLFSIDLFKKKRGIYFISILLFIWAYLMRPNAGLLAFLFILPFVLSSYTRVQLLIKKVIILSIPLVLAIGINFIITEFQDKEYTQNIHRVAKHTFPIIDYNVDTTSYSLEQKQIANELKTWFFFDHKLIDINTYSHFPDIFDRNIPNIDHIVKRLLDLFSMIFHKPFFALLMLITLIPLIFNKPFSFNYLLSICYFLSILFAIAIFLKLEYRILIPFLTIFLVFVLYSQWDFYLLFIINQKVLPFIFLAFIVIVYLFQASLYYKKSEKTIPQSILTELSSNTPLQTVILLTDPTLNYKPTQYISFNSKLIFVPARGWTAYTEENYKFQEKVFGTTNIEIVFKKIALEKNIFFVSDSVTNVIVTNILTQKIKGANFLKVSNENILKVNTYAFRVDTI